MLSSLSKVSETLEVPCGMVKPNMKILILLEVVGKSVVLAGGVWSNSLLDGC